jgi:AbrB family looped-hinge helix DNA binding protein
MRPDGTSYYVVIPKEIRTLLNLKGGEYFIMKAVPEKGGLRMKVVKLADEETGLP